MSRAVVLPAESFVVAEELLAIGKSQADHGAHPGELARIRLAVTFLHVGLIGDARGQLELLLGEAGERAQEPRLQMRASERASQIFTSFAALSRLAMRPCLRHGGEG
jgi:hypothetical protein